MILDSSAILAVLLREPSHRAVVSAMAEADLLAVGTATLAETGLVLTSRVGPESVEILARFVADFDVVVVPFEAQHWPMAVEAFVRFGKGRHPAALNFGDCLTYATARLSSEPLLCLGGDFRQTDVVVITLETGESPDDPS